MTKLVLILFLYYLIYRSLSLYLPLDNIKPICLPNSQQLRSKSYLNYTPFVAGWGKTMEGGAAANVLQELQIPILTNEVCRDSYQRAKRLITADQFDTGVICAGVLSGGKDTCQGDSGGPLMIPEVKQIHKFLALTLIITVLLFFDRLLVATYNSI